MVRESVASALAQTLSDIEIIVVDDGSTDDTAASLREVFGERIRVVEQCNQGESVARNRGIELASAEYIAFLDSDDLWFPEKLAYQVAVLDGNPDIVLVSTWFMHVDTQGNPIEVGSRPRGTESELSSFDMTEIGLRNPFGGGGSTVVARREALLKVGGFDASIRYGEDYDLWLRLRLLGEFAVVPEIQASIRVHADSQVHSLDPMEIDQRLANYLTITERFFEQWPGEVPAGLRERCIAQRYAAIALMDYVGGRSELGRERFEQAIALDGDLARREVGWLVHHFGWVLRRQSEFGQISFSDISEIFDSALRNWPDPLLPVASHERRWLAEEIFEACGWKSVERGEWRVARRCFLRRARIDPLFLANRGVLSTLVRSVMPSR